MSTDHRNQSMSTDQAAMCSYPPTTADPPENYQLDSVSTTVGQIVTAYCKNTSVAIVKCLPNLTWNATVPSCTVKETYSDDMSRLLIILWVVGGVLLFSLLILIMVIVTSKSKTRRGVDGNRSQHSSVFHISGRGSVRGRGGDNPAFSRADELCGEWSYHRADSIPESHRLPSYHEAVLNNYITVPARTGIVDLQDSNGVRNSTDLPRYGNRQLQSSGEIQLSDNITGDPSHGGSDRSNIVTNQISSNQNNGTNETSSRQNNVTNHVRELLVPASNQTTEQGSYIDHVYSSVHPRNSNEDSANTPHRYVENYPQCFFEEEPPPPYTVERTNNGTGQTRSHPRRIQSDTCPEVYVRQREHDFMQNPNFRRTISGRCISSPNSRTSHNNNRTNIQTSEQSSNSAVCSRQQETRLDTRTNIVSSQPRTNTNHLITEESRANSNSTENCVNSNSTESRADSHSNGSRQNSHSPESRATSHSPQIRVNSYSNESRANSDSTVSRANSRAIEMCTANSHSPQRYANRHSTESRAKSNSNGSRANSHSTGSYMLKRFNVSPRPVSGCTRRSNKDVPDLGDSSSGYQRDPSPSSLSQVYTAQQSYVSTITFDRQRNRHLTDICDIQPSNLKTLSVVDIAHDTRSLQPFNTTSFNSQRETQPIGTSTPISQSPAEIRRFVPANHPSPLTIPRNSRFHQKQVPLPFGSYAVDSERDKCTVRGIQEQQHKSNHIREDGQHLKHISQRGAPLARFDGEYSCL